MKAAVLHDVARPPSYSDFVAPSPGPDRVVVTVTAAGVNHLDLARASGTFFTGPPPLPSVMGSDGVGRLADGRRVFFDSCLGPYGSWAEQTLVARQELLEVADGVDDALAAALGNTGLAAWLALDWKADLRPGQTVLVLGASGALGSVAVQVARILGASRVVAAGRSRQRLERLLDRGADALVAYGDLTSDRAVADLSQEFIAASGWADVIIDPLWGRPALAAMKAAAPGARHVQLGQMAGPELTLPASIVRSASLNVLGLATFNTPLEIRRAGYLRLTEHAARGDVVVDLDRLPLSEVSTAWTRQHHGASTKLVLLP
jgi:NADPH:quinone reductase-like Zn-dependent oxidoreductase